MFYCACRSCFVPYRTWLILLAKCIWSAWPPSIIFIMAACEMSTLLLLFHLFNYQMCFPILGVSALYKPRTSQCCWVWAIWSHGCVSCPSPTACLPDFLSVAGTLGVLPASGHPHVLFLLLAVLFPHFPRGSVSKLSCISTTTVSPTFLHHGLHPFPCSRHLCL